MQKLQQQRHVSTSYIPSYEGSDVATWEFSVAREQFRLDAFHVTISDSFGSQWRSNSRSAMSLFDAAMGLE